MKLFSYQQFLNESAQPLNEGGAYGHLHHPFEDFGLTMGDLQKMIDTTVHGAFGPENFMMEKCVSGDSVVVLQTKGPITMKELVDKRYEDSILTQTIDGTVCYMPIVDWVDNSETDDWLIIETDDGKTLKVTPNHRIFANGIDTKAEDLAIGDSVITFQ